MLIPSDLCRKEEAEERTWLPTSPDKEQEGLPTALGFVFGCIQMAKAKIVHNRKWANQLKWHS